MYLQEAYQMMFRQYPDVVNIEQMCEMLGGISTKTAYRLLRDETIQSIKVGKRYRIPKICILAYLQMDSHICQMENGLIS